MNVSVITPLYNCSKTLEDTILSVRSQSYQFWEMIMVDDCSQDSSLEIAQYYAAQDERIKVIQLEQNSGAAVARNTAIKEAKGRYIAFLDSDDQWLPNKLEKQLSFMQENEIAFSYTAYQKIDEQGKLVGTVTVPEKVKYQDLLKVCSIGCLTAMYDTQLLGKVYMPLIRKRQDLGLWLRILKQVPYAYGVQEVLAQYQLRSDSISANKASAAQYTWRLYRNVEKLNIVLASYYFMHYAVNGILRTKFPRLAKVLGKI
ncbi:glycosyltransferase family 2 protein [Thiopseudomonas alkaliphila]|uniref:glycosyltransferase family 2 protein n=1 Tax=Thiopseudomonas alkaliphila TaxID=1697053 RepID=UPI002574F9E1|nr:glycosyltransferase family 2 protein [Thiopseudomonas alkaliphila]MDM1706950.1 glycosyltransferase family 2 protein [Thiopseudomonas alkaliphila]